jgi:hypothetical protein
MRSFIIIPFMNCYQVGGIKRDEMSGADRRKGRMRNAYKILVEKPKRKKPY